MTPTERELIDASNEIGGIYESAAWFTEMLASEIDASGKRVDAHTVAELRVLYREQRCRANETLGSTKY